MLRTAVYGVTDVRRLQQYVTFAGIVEDLGTCGDSSVAVHVTSAPSLTVAVGALPAYCCGVADEAHYFSHDETPTPTIAHDVSS